MDHRSVDRDHQIDQRGNGGSVLEIVKLFADMRQPRRARERRCVLAAQFALDAHEVCIAREERCELRESNRAVAIVGVMEASRPRDGNAA